MFTNTFSEEEARRLYERYHIPASGRVFWASVLANIHPGHDDTYVNYKNPNRAPLLFISGSEDHLMPPSIQRSNAKHYKAEGTITEVVEYEGRAHLMPSQEGLGGGRRLRPDLGRRAGRVLGRRPPGVEHCMTAVRITHVRGPTPRPRRTGAPPVCRIVVTRRPSDPPRAHA